MFLIIETSPGNHQAWLAMPGEHDREFARRVRRGARADITASGATKIAGSLNFKDKYAPAETFAPLSPARPFSRGTDKWPSYGLCLDRAPRNRDGSGPDRSRADYVWCMIAISWGHSVDDTAARLLQKSLKAREEGKSYAMQTARQAADAVERQQQPNRGAYSGTRLPR